MAEFLGAYGGLYFKTVQEVDNVPKEGDKEGKEGDKGASEEHSKVPKEPVKEGQESGENSKVLGEEVREFDNFKVPGRESKERNKESKELSKGKVNDQTPVKAKKLLASSTPKATPRSSVKRKQIENVDKEGDFKKTKKTKKSPKVKADVKKKKADDKVKKDEEYEFKFNESMLNEFINSDVNFTTSTQNNSLSDTMILKDCEILKDYERTYEPENMSDEEDEDETDEKEEDNMEIESDMEVEVLKRKLDELIKLKESHEVEIATLKSEAEEKDTTAKEK